MEALSTYWPQSLAEVLIYARHGVSPVAAFLLEWAVRAGCYVAGVVLLLYAAQWAPR